jgi:uncharacterized membrane protein
MNWKVFRKLVLKRILDYFFQGLIYIAPISLTIYCIIWVLQNIDGQVSNLISVHIPGLGIIILFFLIALLGFVGKRLISNPIKTEFEQLLNKAPAIKLIFTSIRDFLSAFVGSNKKFKEPVLVKISDHIEKLGFITQQELDVLGIKGKVAVYLPYSYSFLGELVIVPKENVTLIDISSAQVMKFVVSGGVSGIDTKEEDEITD